MGTTEISCRSLDFIYCENRKPYVTLTNSLFCHIVNKSSLNNLEKLYYLLTDLYAHLSKKIKGLRETEKSGREWAKLLGCSEEWVFQMQKKLEASGYFNIIREKDEDNQNEKNIIIPTIPDEIFIELSKEPNRFGQEHLIFTKDNHDGGKRSFLDDTKLFIKVNLQMIKLLLSDPALSSLQKLIWLYCFNRSYVSYADSYGDGTRNFITTYKELAAIFLCKENTISTAMNTLSLLGYINKKQFLIKESGKKTRRKKKSCWEIVALFPQDKMKILFQQPDRQNLAPLNLDDLRLYNLHPPKKPISIDNNSTVSNSNYYHDRSAVYHDNQQFNNKNNIINIKNIDPETTKDSFFSANRKVNNVFYEQNLKSSPEEIALGLQISENFNAKVFELAKHTDYPQAIKQADATLTNPEHWVVTKAAYTLQQRLTETVQSQEWATLKFNDSKITQLQETMFTAAEQNLIELWNDFSNITKNKLEKEEFLLRQSWILKLLPTSSAVTMASMDLSSQPNITPIENNIEIPVLPGDKEDKARKFAYALQKRNLAKGYAADISTEELALEFIHHASTWYPEKIDCKTREEQIDAALSFAWKAAEQGKWKCPYQWLNTQIYQREKEATQWKQ